MKTDVKKRPILFSGEMVRAILDGRKSQARRVVKPQPEHKKGGYWYPSHADFKVSWGAEDSGYYLDHPDKPYKSRRENMGDYCRNGKPGDLLWVRETWSQTSDGTVIYKADDEPIFWNWKSPYHMFRRDSRILLEVVSVGVERLQDISEEDAIAEGVNPDDKWFKYGKGEFEGDPVESFKRLWDSINSKTYPWESNPWVWVIEFKRIEA